MTKREINDSNVKVVYIYIWVYALEEGLIVYKADIRTFYTVKLLFTLLFIMIITTVSLMPL